MELTPTKFDFRSSPSGDQLDIVRSEKCQWQSLSRPSLVDLSDFAAFRTAAIAGPSSPRFRPPRDRGEFAHMRSKGLAEILDVAWKLAPLVPHDSEGFAQRLAFVGDPG